MSVKDNDTKVEDLRRSLAQSEGRFRLLFDGIEDAVLMFEVLPDGSRGPIRDVNQACVNRLGYSREELLSMTVEDIDAPESAPERPSVAKRFASNPTNIFEVIHQTKDGRRIPVEVSARKFDYEGTPMVLSIARDISSRKRAEELQQEYVNRLEADVAERTEELSRTNQLLVDQLAELDEARSKASAAERNVRALLDANHQQVVLLALDGTIIHANHAVCLDTNLSSEEMVGRSVFDFMPEEARERRRGMLFRAIETREPVFVRDEIGDRQYAHHLYPLVEDGKVARVAAYTEDVTEEVRRRESLDRSRHVQEVLYEIMDYSQTAESLDRLLESVHELMRRELKATNFCVALTDEQNRTLQYTYCSGREEDCCPAIPDIHDPDNRRVDLLPFRRNDIVQFTREELEAELAEGTVVMETETPMVWLGAPLRLRGKPIGVLVIRDYDNPEPFSVEDLHLVGACSEQIALAIERKQSDTTAREARDIIQNMPTGLYIYSYTPPDTLVLENANPSAERMAGMELKSCKGKCFEEIWGEQSGTAKKKLLAPFLKGQDYIAEDYQHLVKTEMAYARVHSFSLPGSRLCVSFQDITETKKAEAAIRESEEQYRAFFEENRSVMILVDPTNGKIIDANKAAENYYGYSRTVLLSMWVDALNTRPISDILDLMDEMVRRKRMSFIGKHRLASGEVRDVEVFSGPFQIKGKTRLISIVHDITDRIRHERELAEAMEGARQANQAKSQFLANISHEVRTPLNGVMGMLELLTYSELDKDQKFYTETALQSSKNLLRVLNDVLDLSKIEAGKMDIIEEPFDLQTLLEECTDLFKVQAGEKGVRLAHVIDGDTRLRHVGDASRIRQILFNLVGNALKFTETGSVTVSAYQLPHPKPGVDRLFFTVEDTGIGVPDDKIDDIFDSFSQVDGSLTRKHQGTGLGLSIVKRLARLMGGAVAVESEVGKGTAITFFVLVGEGGPVRGEITVRQQPAKASSRKLRVLVVEDERVNQIMAQRMLERMGHTPIMAASGEECLELLETEKADLVLMDIQMPGIDGLEATRIIRSSDKYPSGIPIIALSAHASHQNRRNALEAGMDDYLSKPFDMNKLEDMLGQYGG